MDGLDMLGIVLLAATAAGFLVLGGRAQDGKTNLSLGRFNPDNTSNEVWESMNRAVGRDLRCGGVCLLGLAVALIALTAVSPDGVAGAVGLAACFVGPVAVVWLAAGHAVEPDPNWHP